VHRPEFGIWHDAEQVPSPSTLRTKILIGILILSPCRIFHLPCGCSSQDFAAKIVCGFPLSPIVATWRSHLNLLSINVWIIFWSINMLGISTQFSYLEINPCVTRRSAWNGTGFTVQHLSIDPTRIQCAPCPTLSSPSSDYRSILQEGLRKIL
jgi:hypothetical protein